MSLRFASWSLFLLLLVLLFAHHSGAKDTNERHSREIVDNEELMNRTNYSPVDDISQGTNVLRLHSMDVGTEDLDQIHERLHIQASSHMDHVNPSLIVFFLMENLKEGKTMPIYFPKRDPSSLHLLPKEEADTIPFTLKELPHILQLFSFPQGSSQAKAMEDTLMQCEMNPIKGENKFCATSFKSMLDFASSIFKFESEIDVLSTSYLTESTSTILLQNYTITNVPREIQANKMVACHTMPYPYAVFYCHSQESESKVFKVLLVGENGEEVEAVAVCHMNTSGWSRNHASFRVLGIEPGTSPVCHFFPADNLVWIPRTV